MPVVPAITIIYVLTVCVVFFSFFTAKIAQMTGVDPEDALHCACDKFDARFRQVEESAEKPLDTCTKEELLALWAKAKETLS